MTEIELKIQKQIVPDCEKPKAEIPRLFSEVHKLGHTALVSHVYSDYTMHEELN